MKKLCLVSEVKVGVPLSVSVGEGSDEEEAIVVFRVNTSDGEKWFGTQEMCTHAKISLAIGFIVEDQTNGGPVVECSAHGAQFSLESGEVLCAPAISPIKTYNIVSDGEWVYLDDTSDDVQIKPEVSSDEEIEEEIEVHGPVQFNNFSLNIEDVSVSLDDDSKKQILNSISFNLKPGELTVLKGTNGSGKSSFCHALMGNPEYSITSGSIFADYGSVKKDITNIPTYEKAQLGIFLSPQSPTEIPGVSVEKILQGYGKKLNSEEVKKVGLERVDLNRGIHDGFSGGEKKRVEALLVNEIVPPVVIFDEIDSGLDVEALKVIAQTIEFLVSSGSAVLVISHLDELLSKLKPNKTYELVDKELVSLG